MRMTGRSARGNWFALELMVRLPVGLGPRHIHPKQYGNPECKLISYLQSAWRGEEKHALQS